MSGAAPAGRHGVIRGRDHKVEALEDDSSTSKRRRSNGTTSDRRTRRSPLSRHGSGRRRSPGSGHSRRRTAPASLAPIARRRPDPPRAPQDGATGRQRGGRLRGRSRTATSASDAESASSPLAPSRSPLPPPLPPSSLSPLPPFLLPSGPGRWPSPRPGVSLFKKCVRPCCRNKRAASVVKLGGVRFIAAEAQLLITRSVHLSLQLYGFVFIHLPKYCIGRNS